MNIFFYNYSMDHKMAKEIYEKNKLSITYDEFVSLMEQLQNSFQTLYSNDTEYKCNNKIIDTDKSLKISNSLISNEIEITDNSTLELNSNSSELNELSNMYESSKTKEISESDLLSFGNNKIKIINYMDINEDNVSQISTDNLSENLLDKSSSISYPSEFTSDKKLNFNGDTLISYSSEQLKESQKIFKTNNDTIEKNNFNYTSSKNNTSTISNTDTNSNTNSSDIKLNKSLELTKMSNESKNNNINEILTQSINKINIKVNPNIKYNIDIDVDNNINISIK
jgi:hypothetical protein